MSDRACRDFQTQTDAKQTVSVSVTADMIVLRWSGAETGMPIISPTLWTDLSNWLDCRQGRSVEVPTDVILDSIDEWMFQTYNACKAKPVFQPLKYTFHYIESGEGGSLVSLINGGRLTITSPRHQDAFSVDATTVKAQDVVLHMLEKRFIQKWEVDEVCGVVTSNKYAIK